MAKPATTIPASGGKSRPHEYEQPLNERMRTFMRLEFLYQQMLVNAEQESDWAARTATDTLLDVIAILTRGDVRSDALKELDHQLDTLRRFQSQPGVDTARLDSLVGTLDGNRRELQAVGAHYLQPLKESEFLSAIKHRSSIPGGTCEFDLPEFSHWLRLPYERRQQDLSKWITVVRPVCDAVSEVLWLIREIAEPLDKLAINGMYHHNMPKNVNCQLLRVTLPPGSPLYPEISGGHHRFTIRFLEWSAVDARAAQTGHDVNFRLSVC